jgi:hypothetical protein
VYHKLSASSLKKETTISSEILVAFHIVHLQAQIIRNEGTLCLFRARMTEVTILKSRIENDDLSTE